MGRIVIACYRPKPGHDAGLADLIRTHVATLRSIGLATTRPPIAMRAADGSILEVFEWASEEAIAAAHHHPVVLQMWEAFGKVCDYVPMAQVAEAAEMFASFTPVDVEG